MVDLVLFGVSNMLSDLFDCALALGHRVTRVVRNQPEILRPRTKSVAERIAVLTPPPELLDIDAFEPRAGEIYALGTTSPGRFALVERLEQSFGIRLTTLVHPRAYVSPLAQIGAGVFIGSGAIIGPGATLGDHVFINRAVSIGHDTVVESFARLQPGAHIAGHVRIGAFTTIGMAACVLEEREIGSRATVGAGAVVVHDVPDGATVMGVPARVVVCTRA